jgi:hypothetical protein
LLASARPSLPSLQARQEEIDRLTTALTEARSEQDTQRRQRVTSQEEQTRTQQRLTEVQAELEHVKYEHLPSGERKEHATSTTTTTTTTKT